MGLSGSFRIQGSSTVGVEKRKEDDEEEDDEEEDDEEEDDEEEDDEG